MTENPHCDLPFGYLRTVAPERHRRQDEWLQTRLLATLDLVDEVLDPQRHGGCVPSHDHPPT